MLWRNNQPHFIPFYFSPRVKDKEGKKDSKFQGLGDQDDSGVTCNNGDFVKS